MAEKKVKVKLIANIKYGEAIHSLGETIYIDKSDLDEFKRAGVIEIKDETADDLKPDEIKSDNNESDVTE